jgi:hypothetical protein
VTPHSANVVARRRPRGSIAVVLFLAGSLALLAAARRSAVHAAGDSAEYLAMMLAFTESATPYATRQSLETYEQYVVAHPGLRWMPQLGNHVNTFGLPDGTYDFAHFWLFSLLAAPFALACRALGIDVIHGFGLANCLLAAVAIAIAAGAQRRAGAVVAISLLFLSPTLWYVNKAHTELMTSALGIAAIALVLRRQFTWASLVFALLATQNIPFAAFAILSGVLALVFDRRFLFTKAGVVVAVCSGALAVAHPLYYLVRHGVITPQMKNGGVAQAAPSLRTLLVVFVDPDVGLFLNWPFATVLLVISGALLATKGRPFWRRWWPQLGFLTLYVSVMAYAHASTANLNHGAAPVMTRYAFWYMPVLYAAACLCFHWAEGLPRAARRGLGLVTTAGLAATTLTSLPARADRYCVPSHASKWIYQWTPSLYDPAPEIFAERYSGACEDFGWNTWAVLNRSCTKALLLRDHFPGAIDGNTPRPVGCLHVNPKLLHALAKPELERSARNPLYLNLDAQTARSIRRGEFYVPGQRMNFEGERPVFLGDGWSGPEPMGVWTDGQVAELFFALEAPTGSGAHLALEAAAFMPDGRARRITVEVNERQIGHLEFRPETRAVALAIPAGILGAENRLRFLIADPVSPSELGLSARNLRARADPAPRTRHHLRLTRYRAS